MLEIAIDKAFLMNTEKDKPKKLLIVADLGASNPKFIISFKKNEPDYLILDSRIQKVSASSLDKYRKEEEWLFDERLASKDAFLNLANEDDYWVFGDLSQYFDPEQRLDKEAKKYELGALRILCGLGLLTQQQGIKHRNFNLDLCVLLPVNEFGDQNRFLKYFENMAKNWYFRGEAFSCTLRKTKIEREGASTLRYLLSNKQYKDKYRNQTLGLVMAGYRNLSFFLLRDLKVEVQESPIKGFHQCIENISKNNSVIEPPELNAAMAKAYYSLLRYELETLPRKIYQKFEEMLGEERNFSSSDIKNKFQNGSNLTQNGKLFQYHFLTGNSHRIDHQKYLRTYTVCRLGGTPSWEKCPEIQKLIKSKTSDLAEQELNDLVNDINKELEAYGEQFQTFLERYFQEVDQLLILGGASIFLYHWLSSFCNYWDQFKIEITNQKDNPREENYIYSKFSPPYESSEYTPRKQAKKTIYIDSLPQLKEELVKDFSLDEKEQIYSSIPLRFLDCYCFYKLCLNQIKKEDQEERRQKKAEEMSEEGAEN